MNEIGAQCRIERIASSWAGRPGVPACVCTRASMRLPRSAQVCRGREADGYRRFMKFPRRTDGFTWYQGRAR